MFEIHQVSKLYAMSRPDGEDNAEALFIIRRDSERVYAEDPFGIVINKNQA